jgi:hypothetical protein
LPAAERTALFPVGRISCDAPRRGRRPAWDKPVADRHLYAAIKKLMSLRDRARGVLRHFEFAARRRYS